MKLTNTPPFTAGPPAEVKSGSDSFQAGLSVEATAHMLLNPEPQPRGSVLWTSVHSPCSQTDVLTWAGSSVGNLRTQAAWVLSLGHPDFLPTPAPTPCSQVPRLTNNEALRVWKLLKELSEVFISLLVSWA